METAKPSRTCPNRRDAASSSRLGGEEAGLLGSKYWIDHSTVPLKQVAAAANVDMIGRLRSDRVIIYGDRSSYGSRNCSAATTSRSACSLISIG